LPAWQTAIGHVLLARLPNAALAARLRDAGEINLARLRRELAAARRRGVILVGCVLTREAITIAAAVSDRLRENRFHTPTRPCRHRC
jgi:DNA-binding IclR family transcriptional regulator